MVFRKLKIVSIFAFYFSLVGNLYAASYLENARINLKNNNLEKADFYYKKITFANKNWANKLEDFLRYNFLSSNYNDAWKYSELIKRLNLNINNTSYYSYLSLLFSQTCLYNYKQISLERMLLGNAFMLRFSSSFRQRAYKSDTYNFADNSTLLNHLGKTKKHYLADISKVKIIPRVGCSAHKTKLTNTSKTYKNELLNLVNWIKLKNISSINYSNKYEKYILLRVIYLADSLQLKPILNRFIKYYVNMTSENWLSYSNSDRRYLWGVLVKYKIIKNYPYHDKKTIDLIVKIILATKNKDVVYWLGLFNIYDLSNKVKYKVIRHISQLNITLNMSYVLALDAKLSYYKGDVAHTLSVIRRLLINEEHSVDNDVYDYLLNLAIDIFTEYKYDKKMLLSLQSSVPLNAWKNIIKYVLIEQAFSGQQKAYNNMLRAFTIKTMKKYLGYNKRELYILKSILTRNFKKINYSFTMKDLSLINDFAVVLIRLDKSKRLVLEPMVAMMSNVLTKFYSEGKRQKNLLKLIDLFNSIRTKKNSQKVLSDFQAVSTTGVVKLNERNKLVLPFKWVENKSVLKRKLLYLPKEFSKRNFEISIENGFK